MSLHIWIMHLFHLHSVEHRLHVNLSYRLPHSSRMRGDIDVPLTAEILKESRHQIQRRGLFQGNILKVSHCAPCIRFFVSFMCESAQVSSREENQISYPLFPPGSRTEQAEELSVWKHRATERWRMKPPPPLVVSLSLPLSPPLWIGC